MMPAPQRKPSTADVVLLAGRILIALAVWIFLAVWVIIEIDHADWAQGSFVVLVIISNQVATISKKMARK